MSATMSGLEFILNFNYVEAFPLYTLAFSKLISFSWRLDRPWFPIFDALLILAPLSRISFSHSHQSLHAQVILLVMTQIKCYFLHEAFSSARWCRGLSTPPHPLHSVSHFRKNHFQPCSDFFSTCFALTVIGPTMFYDFHLYTSSLLEWILKLVCKYYG